MVFLFCKSYSYLKLFYNLSVLYFWKPTNNGYKTCTEYFNCLKLMFLFDRMDLFWPNVSKTFHNDIDPE